MSAILVFLLFSFQALDESFCGGQSWGGKADTAALLEILAHGSKFFDEPIPTEERKFRIFDKKSKRKMI